MSSNLTLEAKVAYQHYLDAKTLDDRIEKLQTLISLIPKHKAILRLLTDHYIYLNRPPPQIKVEKTGTAKIQVFFLTPSAKESEIHAELLIDMARAYGAANATVKVFDRVSVQEIEMAFNRNSRYKRAVIVATKADLPNTKDYFAILQKKYGGNSSPSFGFFLWQLFMMRRPDKKCERDWTHFRPIC